MLDRLPNGNRDSVSMGELDGTIGHSNDSARSGTSTANTAPSPVNGRTECRLSANRGLCKPGLCYPLFYWLNGPHKPW